MTKEELDLIFQKYFGNQELSNAPTGNLNDSGATGGTEILGNKPGANDLGKWEVAALAASRGIQGLTPLILGNRQQAPAPRIGGRGQNIPMVGSQSMFGAPVDFKSLLARYLMGR